MTADLSNATLTECEAVIQRSLDAFVEAGRALVRIRDQELYKARFRTFEDYCTKKWGFSRQRSQQLIAAAEVVSTLSVEEVKVTLPQTNGHAPDPVVVPPPTNERVARELAPLRAKPEEMREVWREAAETAATYGRQPTSTDVRTAVQGRVMGPVVEPPAAPAPGSDEQVDQIIDGWTVIANAAKEAIALERRLVSSVDLTDTQRWRIAEAHKHALRVVEER
jgi:hypothetical protein